MIQSFTDSDTRSLYEGRRVKRFSSFAVQAERRLAILDAVASLKDLKGLPSNRLEKLAGDRKGQYSIRINSQWRICFRWTDNGPGDVEVVDYH